MARTDVAFQVRGAAVHVWKTLVGNTPKTLGEILPVLMQQLITSLASQGVSRGHKLYQVSLQTGWAVPQRPYFARQACLEDPLEAICVIGYQLRCWWATPPKSGVGSCPCSCSSSSHPSPAKVPSMSSACIRCPKLAKWAGSGQVSGLRSWNNGIMGDTLLLQQFIALSRQPRHPESCLL